MKTLFTIIFISANFLPDIGHAVETERVGYAYAQDSGELIYTETHNEIRKDGRIISDTVTYHDANGKLFAVKNVDYSPNPLAPDFHLKNSRTGHTESGKNRGEKYQVKFSESDQADIESKTLPLPEDAVADAGFDELIISQWEDIVADKPVTRKFLIPGLLSFYDFRIYQAEVQMKDGERSRVIHVEPDNFFYRLLGGTTRLVYAYDEPRLKVFQGVSNMRDAEGDNLQVKIVFPVRDIGVVSRD
ncbi:MAG: hypothetical protein GTN46_09210 [Gammaproteobacteria bacterium]|nr:hypothetical protein [Gammaproteobacteria bacterium]